jgi:filamentous hemagglutinin family protein
MKLASFRRRRISGPPVVFALMVLAFPARVPVRGGDILRGGAPAGSPAQRTAAATRSTAAAAAAARSNARDHLSRTTRALQSVRNLQSAARAAATGNHAGINPNAPGSPLPNVADGLRASGLEVDPGVGAGTAVWSGASLPIETAGRGATTVNIRQTRQTALLNWKTFNVGRNTTLRFDQSEAGADANKWIAFNKVNDPSNAPSQILGSIEAPGQVYVINRNGILFGAGSQVNVGTLVASSLPINDNLVGNGLLNNPDAQFLFSGIAIPTGSQGTPAFTPEPANPAIGRYGDVIVQRGATINSPTNEAKSGGRVMLVGPNVRQAGSILAPDGQVVLAAGMQVGIAAHSSNDPSLRGLDVYVGSVLPPGGGDPAGLVEQSGLVEARRGNITVAGREIRIDGALESSTSVSLNGRIDLQASYDAIPNTAYNPSNPASGSAFLPQKTGIVRFGAGSVTRILPELASDEKVVGREIALPSQVNVSGRAIHLGENAAIQAPSGKVRLATGEWRLLGLGSANPNARFVQSGGQVYLDTGALIDVAGLTGVSVPILQHILSLELRGAELANSPLQRESSLRGATIQVDVRDQGTHNGIDWVGTPFADATGFAGLIQRTVAEFSTKGGEVTITAGDSVVMRGGAKIDASGGYLNYEGGKFQTTRFVLENRVVDIRDATPERLYGGIYTGRMSTRSERWGVTRIYDQPLALTGERYEPAYVQGAAGGRIDISAPGMVLDGTLSSRTLEGPRQRENGADPGLLRLAFLAQDPTISTFPFFSPTPPAITFSHRANLRAADDFTLDPAGEPTRLRTDRLDRVVLSPGLLGNEGFGSLIVENPDGNVTVPKDVSLDAAEAGTVRLTASNLTLDGRVTAPGGELSFSAYNQSLAAVNASVANRVKPPVAPGRGSLIVGSTAVLSTAGLLVDDRRSSSEFSQVTLNGGTITLSGFDVALRRGGLVDVSGGAQIGSTGEVSYGDAGSISITAGRDQNINELFGGSLALGGRLLGASGARAGTLTISALAFQVGGTSASNGVTRLDPAFFSRGGFGTFSLTGMGLPGQTPDTFVPGILIAPGTRIRPIAERLVAVPNPASRDGASLQTVSKPEGLRPPVNLAFTATGAADSFNSGFPISRGDLVMSPGSSIVTDGLGNVSLRGETATIFGKVVAPGGTISVTGASAFPLSGEALTTVYLGNGAHLSAAGKPVIRENPLGWREGSVLAGGTIDVSGNIVAERGAFLDVSGTRGTIDRPATYRNVSAEARQGFGGQEYVPVRFHSNGGSIKFAGAQMLYSDARLLAESGGPSATGGSLYISSGRFIDPGVAFTSADNDLIVTQSGNVLANAGPPRGIGLPVRDATGATQPGLGTFTADRFQEGRFGSLSLAGNVRFSGDVSIDAPASLRVADGGVIYADGAVRLEASYVSLGRAFRTPSLATDQILLYTQTDALGVTTPYFFAPSHGPGSLSVFADHIDIGDLSVQGAGTTRLDARGGDLRGNGTLQVSGSLSLLAGQVYPTTLGAFNLFAYDPAGGTGRISVTSGPGGTREVPLSAGGSLSLYASEISQNGTLRAPIGTINLGWDGTGTAPLNPIAGSSAPTPVADSLELGSRSTTSVAGLDPGSRGRLVIPFGISFDGNSWIDPAGNDITVGGVPGKNVNLSATSVISRPGSLIDIRGGGDLYAYRWVTGNGGTRDTLSSTSRFAVIPGYDFNYAPYAPFNVSSAATNLQGEPGYVNANLKVGDRVRLGGSSALPTGTYTLLPARYALLPGAVLVTPLSGEPVGSRPLEDGASLVSGYRFNDLDPARTGTTKMARFEVAPASVVRQRAEYLDLHANSFLSRAASTRGFTVPRLPVDSGYLSFNSTAAMSLAGRVVSTPPIGGRGSLIDISSPGNILVNVDGSGGGPGILALSSSLLSSFRAESLLLGGKRTLVDGRYQVSVSAANLTIDNAGAGLIGEDLIFAATGTIDLRDGSTIEGTGNARLDALSLGDPAVAGSGDGTLLRVSGSRNAPVTRSGVSNSTTPLMRIGGGSFLSGGSITVDSSSRSNVARDATFQAPVLALNSGRISIQLENPGGLVSSDSLVLSGQALATIQETTTDLTLLSYSSIELYGTGVVGSRSLDRLTLRATALEGYNQRGGEFGFSADRILLENAAARPVTTPAAAPDGRLRFDAERITLGHNDLRAEGFRTVTLAADAGLEVSGTGSFTAAGDLDLITPLVTGAGAARHRVAASSALRLIQSGTVAGITGGLGASLSLEGGTVEVDTNVVLNSGEIAFKANGGDLVIGNTKPALISTGGVSRPYLDLSRHTGGGTITLVSNSGNITLGGGATLDVSATNADAGFLDVLAPAGSFTLGGKILGGAGAGRRSGSFSLDAASVAGNDLTATDTALNTGLFNESRQYRLRTGNLTISGTALARDYRATVDAGSLTVTGSINASGNTGGRIDLAANGDLVLAPGSLLDASGETFNAAGKGGSVFLGAGTSRNGVIDPTAMLELDGGTIDLSVTALNASSASRGQFSGTLHLRAPQNTTRTDLQMDPVATVIDGASSIVVEGFRIYDRASSSGALNNTLLTTIENDGNAFLGAEGIASANYTAMLGTPGIPGRLNSLQPSLDLILVPGAEIINRSGGLTLGSTSSPESSDWNLASLRFGPRSAAGVLTLRARDNLDLFNAISDGFAGGPSLWLSPLVAHNPLLPANTQSWSYRFTAGADFTAANPSAVRSLGASENAGMIRLGKNSAAATASGGANALTSAAIANRFQVIRTGSGSIDLHAARSVQLLNPFASIYTAGTQVANPTSVFAPNDFVTPILVPTSGTLSNGSLGAVQQNYPAQYAMAGGDVTIRAGENIERKTRNTSGALIDDSSRQLPNNWLYRRGYVGPDGTYGAVRIGSGFNTFLDPAASTSWWVDYSNFFQSVGALGGGNVTLFAGKEVRNVDAVIPTNARAPLGIPDASRILELGGGDLIVRSGGDINGGVYYVERGIGRLEASGSITTNATRSPSLGLIQNLNNPASAQFDANTWMPTTLFLGRSSFEVSARGDVLLGPMANPFLLPQGLNNRFWYKTYFSTYGEDASVDVTSLGGDVTLRNAMTILNRATATDAITLWMQTQNLLATGPTGAANSQPWLRLSETSVDPFGAVQRLRPPTLRTTALAGDISLAGSITLSPAASGQLELVAAGSLNAFQPTGLTSLLVPGRNVQAWTSTSVNVSDASPLSVPSLTNPFNYFALVATRDSLGNLTSSANANNSTRAAFLDPVARLFTDSPSTTGNFGLSTTKQSLHDARLLHRNDPEPLRLYALGGNLSGLTLFSPKPSRVHASGDLTDISFYLQNLAASDSTVITAGRDIIPNNSASALRNAALTVGNFPAANQVPLPGDIHLGGPGTLQVLAGRNLDLGTGRGNPDGSGSGILTIGNTRNPFLDFGGADLFAGAGLGLSTSLDDSRPDFDRFISDFVETNEGRAHLRELGIRDFDALVGEERVQAAMEVFYLVLRDAGRDFNDEDSPDFGTYDNGFAAIRTLFGGARYQGDLLARARSIRSQNGGDIALFAPGGGLALANTLIGDPLVPPGIVTETGGRVSIFTRDSVDIGVGRIFTLRGGDMIIWSSEGDIAAGVASKTVQSAPPTRVLIDPQSAAVVTDLAGLATGGGIGVLATVAGVKPGNVDLIAPSGIIDAGDAGIRVTGNINLAATQVVNASNIAVGGSSSGAPAAPAVSAPNVGGLTAGAANAAAANTAAMEASESAKEKADTTAATDAADLTPSLISVEVIGYGGGGTGEDEEEEGQ